MPLPNFLCVGAQKAGTTTLYNILLQHPQIYLPEEKETKFFFDDKYYSKGLKYYEKEFFSRVTNEKAIGEIDPEYMYFEYVAGRIYKALGQNVKLIFMLRNPADRAYSHYLMSKSRGYETNSFLKAIEIENRRIKSGIFSKNHFSYIDRGLYSKQIERFLYFFPRKNMFFIIFEEDFLKDREITFRKLFKFLEVDENIKVNLNIKSNEASTVKSKFLQKLLYNQSYLLKHLVRLILPKRKWRYLVFSKLDSINKKPISYKNKMLFSSCREKLIKEIFIEDIKKLEKLINRDLSVWYKW